MSFSAKHVKVIDDLIPPDLLVEVLKDVKERGFSFGWHSNRDFEFGHWNIKFGGSKKSRHNAFLEMPPSVGKIWMHVQAALAEQLAPYRLIRGYVNSMPYGAEGWPHTDSQVDSDLSLVIYLNPEWQIEWFGETVMFDDTGEIVKSVLPKFGRLTMFPGAMLHAARAVSRICPEQRLVLVFKAARE